MSFRARLRSTSMILAAAVLLPPAGLVLLWMRRGTGVLKKTLGTMGILAVSVAYLVVLFGLRLQPDGSGIPKILTFSRPEAQAAAIERHRIEQLKEIPPPELAKSTAASAAPESPIATGAPDPIAGTKSPTPAAAYWTEFRGPRRDGHYDQTPISTEWPEKGLPLVWKQPAGGGYASFAVAHGRAFTIEQRRDREVVAAYHLATGRELWTHSWTALFEENMGGDGPRATPTWHEGRVYALGAAGTLACLDAQAGKLLWSRNILQDGGAENLQWGMAASPLVVDDRLIVLPGGQNGKSVAAYDRRTGEILWTALDDKQAYTSPMLVTLAGKRQLLIVSSKRVLGAAVEDGSLLWEFPWVTQYDTNSAQPIVLDESHIIVSAGYDHGAALLEITRAEDRFSARPVWQNTNLKNRFNSSVLHEGHIYGLDEGILVCIDARTGERKWKGGRYGYGQVLLAQGHLIITTERGEVKLVRTTPAKLEEVAGFQALSGKTWNNPAIADGLLLVRNATEMAAFRLYTR